MPRQLVIRPFHVKEQKEVINSAEKTRNKGHIAKDCPLKRAKEVKADNSDQTVSEPEAKEEVERERVAK